MDKDTKTGNSSNKKNTFLSQNIPLPSKNLMFKIEIGFNIK